MIDRKPTSASLADCTCLNLARIARIKWNAVELTTTGNQTCHPGAPFCAPGVTFLCPGVTFLCPGVTVLRPRGIFLCPGVNFLCSSSSATLKLNLHLILLLLFFLKMLKDNEFDDDNKSDELQNDGVVMLKGIQLAFLIFCYFRN